MVERGPKVDQPRDEQMDSKNEQINYDGVDR